MRALCWVPVAIALAGCGTQSSRLAPITLAYAPTAPLSTPTPSAVVALAAVVDGRGGDPGSLGQTRGTLGTPTRQLVSEHTTVREVHQAFLDALLARGMLSPAGMQRYDLTVKLLALSGQGRLDQTASADFQISVRRHGTDDVVYADEVKVAAMSGSLPSLDTLVFESTADMGALINHVMNQAIDQALDKPALLTSLKT